MSEARGETPAYQVILTDEAFYALTALPSDRLFQHVSHDLELLETTPELGRVYDPVYEAVTPPFACRVLFCENYGIYYRLNSETRTLTVFAIEDQRRNPLGRFAAYEYAVTSLDEPASSHKTEE